jgi:hypothetical protein
MRARSKAERIEAADGPEQVRNAPSVSASLPLHAGTRSLLPRLLDLPWPPLFLLMASLGLAALKRPPIAGIDTPALAAAWEIVRSDHWLLWHEAGGRAGEAAPLLAWLIALGWSAFGVGIAWPWLLCAIALSAALLLTRRLAQRLWPQRADAGALAGWLFAGSAGVLLLGPAITPDGLGAGLAAGGLLGLVIAAGGRRRGWVLFAACLSLLLLALGASGVAVLLAPALAGPAWARTEERRSWLGWYGSLLLAATAAALPALWLHQAAGDIGGWMVATDGPSLVPLLAFPLFFYPWPFWPRLWRSARRQSNFLGDGGVRLCLIALLALLAGFVAEGSGPGRLLLASPAICAVTARLLAGRLPGRADFHAGIPALPLALLGALPIAINTVPWAQLAGRARELAGVELPIWIADVGVGGAMIVLGGTFLLIQGTPRQMLSRVAHLALLPTVLVAAVAWEMAGALGSTLDPGPMAARLSALQSQQVPVAVFGDPSDYAFAGRLERPLPQLVSIPEALAWARAHPDGAALAPFRGSVLHLQRQPTYAAPQGASWVALWPAGELIASDGAVLEEPR